MSTSDVPPRAGVRVDGADHRPDRASSPIELRWLTWRFVAWLVAAALVVGLVIGFLAGRSNG